MATVEGRTNSKKQRNSAPGLTLDAAKSGDIVTGEHVEKERVCVSCTDLLLRSEVWDLDHVSSEFRSFTLYCVIRLTGILVSNNKTRWL